MKRIALMYFLIGFAFSILIQIYYLQPKHNESLRTDGACEAIKILNESNSIAQDKQLSINIFYNDHCR